MSLSIIGITIQIKTEILKNFKITRNPLYANRNNTYYENNYFSKQKMS